MKYKVILIILGISLAISVVLGTSYAIWLLTDTQVDDNVVEAGCFDVSFTGNTDGISLLNSYPVPDSVGSQNTPFNFTVTNTCDLDAYYDINVEVLDTTTLDSSLIKVKLDSNNPLIVTDGEAKPATISGASAYKIGEGYLEPGDAGTHDFRMWMDYSATLDNSQNAVIYTKIVINTSPVDTDIIDTSVCLGDYEHRRLTPTELSRFVFTETDTEATITGYNGGGLDIIIPCEINGKPVTTIGERAFWYSQMTSLVLPIGLRTISDNAFYNNSLTNLNIPEGVESIGNNAFYQTYGKLKYLSLPDSLITIGDSAFYNNSGVLEITIPDKVVSIGVNAFWGNGGSLSTLHLGKSVESIGSNAFYGQNISNLIIPDNVKSIGSNAFDSNNISTLSLGRYLNKISAGAFANNNLSVLNLPINIITIESSSFVNNPLTTINIEGKSRIEDFALLVDPWYTGTPTINWIP